MAGEALVRAPNPDPPSGVGVVVDQAALRPTSEGASHTRPIPFGASLRGIGVRQHCLTKKQKKGVLRTPKKAKKNVATPQKFYDIPKNEVSVCPYDIPK